MRVRNARPENKPYKLFDGGGLFLLVKPLADKSGDGKAAVSKLWKVRYRYLGNEKEYAVGACRHLYINGLFVHPRKLAEENIKVQLTVMSDPKVDQVRRSEDEDPSPDHAGGREIKICKYGWREIATS
jgi:hypothetical protein